MNRFWAILCILFFQWLYLHAQPKENGLLEKHLFQERLILLFSDNEKDEAINRQLQSLNTHAYGLMQRNILIYVISPQSVVQPSGQRLGLEEAQALYQQFMPEKKGFALIFIDLNGLENWRSNQPIPAHILFQYIDTTPLRRSEILDSLINALSY